MEVIKNGLSSDKLIEVTCDHCHSVLRCTELEVNHCNCPVCGKPLRTEALYFCENCGHHFSTTSPMEIGVYGEYYVECPRCRQRVYLDDGIDITTDNLKLEYFSSHEDAKPVEFPEIKAWIDKGIKHLKENPDENYYYTATGDSFVLVTRDGEEFYVMYSNNYRDVWIN